MMNFAAPYFIAGHLHLGALPTINQEQLVVKGNYLGSWMTVVGWKRRIVAKYGYPKHALKLKVTKILRL